MFEEIRNRVSPNFTNTINAQIPKAQPTPSAKPEGSAPRCLVIKRHGDTEST